jgi:2'-5' RNA ligase
MRLFIAITLCDSVRTRLSQLCAELKARLADEPRSLSWVKAENLHVTIKFLGEVSESSAPDLCTALAAVPKSGTLTLRASALHCLPRYRLPRVIAASLTGHIEELTKLHHHIEMQCGTVGFPPEGRKFLPHITFARVKHRLRVHTRDLERWAQPFFPTAEMTATDFVLMESRLGSAGAQYFPLATFPIGA